MSRLYPQNIGETMPNGFAGSYARQPDMIINTRQMGGSASIAFGLPIKYNADGEVVPMGAGSAATDFLGVAAREIKSALTYLTQSPGEYAPGEAVPVFQRGAINVFCRKGTAKPGGAVYVRITANATYPNAPVGGFEAEADGENTVQLTTAQWAGKQDGNNIAELRLLTMAKA